MLVVSEVCESGSDIELSQSVGSIEQAIVVVEDLCAPIVSRVRWSRNRLIDIPESSKSPSSLSPFLESERRRSPTSSITKSSPTSRASQLILSTRGKGKG